MPLKYYLFIVKYHIQHSTSTILNIVPNVKVQCIIILNEWNTETVLYALK